MNKTPAKIISLAISLIVFAIYWYMALPAFNLTDYYFLGGVILFALVYYIALVLLTEDADVVKTVPNIVIISVISIFTIGATVLSLFATPLFQAKNYSDLIQVETKEFNTDFPNTDINKQLIKSHNLKSLASIVKSQSKMNLIVYHLLAMQVLFVG